MQRYLDQNQGIYVSFIDFEKAFDKAQHEKLVGISQRKNIDKTTLIVNL